MATKIKTGSKSPLLAATIDDKPAKKRVARSSSSKVTGTKVVPRSVVTTPTSAVSNVSIRLAQTQVSNKKGVTTNSLTLYVKTAKGLMSIPISAAEFGDLIVGHERDFEAEIARK